MDNKGNRYDGIRRLGPGTPEFVERMMTDIRTTGYQAAAGSLYTGELASRANMRVPMVTSMQDTASGWATRLNRGRVEGRQLVVVENNDAYFVVDELIARLGTMMDIGVKSEWMSQVIAEQAEDAPDLFEMSSPARRYRCDGCTELFHRWDVQASSKNGNRIYFCFDCHSHCVWCDQRWLNKHFPDSGRLTRGDQQLCQSCYDADFRECEGCGYAIQRSSIGGSKICHECYIDREGSMPITDEITPDNSCSCNLCTNGMLRPYDHDAAQHFGKWPEISKPKDGLYCGVELETELVNGQDRDDMVRKIHRLAGRFTIQKTDGSLNYGIEIVSMPLEHQLAKEAWGGFLKKRAEQKLGLRSWNTTTCGMHVHLSRRALGELAIEKMARWMILNQPFCEQIAGRAGNGYARFENRGWGFTRDRNRNGGKYQALNVCKTPTVEFRLFKGTLNVNSFLRNLDFCFALARWCRDEAGVSSTKVQDFALYVMKHRKTYPHLYEWMQQGGYLETIIATRPVRPHKPMPGVVKPEVQYVDNIS